MQTEDVKEENCPGNAIYTRYLPSTRISSIVGHTTQGGKALSAKRIKPSTAVQSSQCECTITFDLLSSLQSQQKGMDDKLEHIAATLQTVVENQELILRVDPKADSMTEYMDLSDKVSLLTFFLVLLIHTSI